MLEEGRSPRERLESQLERAERKGDDLRAEALRAELRAPPFPKAVDYIWRAFIRLRLRTKPGPSGPAPISWTEIDAFVRQSRMRLDPWEIRLVEDLDGLYLAAESRRSKRDLPPSPEQTPGMMPAHLPRRHVAPRR